MRQTGGERLPVESLECRSAASACPCGLVTRGGRVTRGPREEPEAVAGDFIWDRCLSVASSELCWHHPQAWKNATLAEQAKLPTTEKPVLLSKDIEAKMMALDREVQYLLNKAKFAKPRPKPKDKNETRAEPPLNASASDQGEKVIPPPGEAGAWLQVLLGRRKPFPLESHFYSWFSFRPD